MSSPGQPHPAPVDAQQATLRRFATAASFSAAGAGLIALAGVLGYAPGWRFLTSIRPHYVPMAASTAACLLILSPTLWFHARASFRGVRGSLAATAAVLAVTVFAALEAIEPLVGRDISLENWLLPKLGTFGGISIERMSPVTGTATALAGVATLLLLREARAGRHAGQRAHAAASLGVMTALIGATILLAYLYGAPLMYGGATRPMAATSAVALILLGAAVVGAAGPASFPARLLVGDSTAAILARAFLPLTVSAILLESVVARSDVDWFGLPDTLLTALMVAVAVVVTVVVVVRVAHTAGARLDESSRKLRDSETRYRTLYQQMDEGFCVVEVIHDREGRAVDCRFLETNVAFEKHLGLEHAVGRTMSELAPNLGADWFDLFGSVARSGSPIRLEKAAFTLQQYFDVYAFRIGEAGSRRVGLLFRDITERRRANEQLRQSEESLAITLASIGDAVIATDAAGRITRMNATAERLTGWSLAGARGSPADDVFRLVDARTRTPLVNPVERVLREGTTVTVAVNSTLLARDGGEYQISDSAAPIRNSAGEMVGVVLVFNDVSEEYRVRKALADSADLLERTGAIAKIGGWQLDLRTNDLIWSHETCRIHEVDEHEALTVERAINFYSPEARPIIQAAVQAAAAEGTSFDLELPLVTAKGRPIWVRAQGTPMMEHGKAVELHGAFQDITERKLAEQYLRESEERHRLLADNAADVIFTMDVGGRFSYVSPSVARLLGYRSAEVMQHAFDDLLAPASIPAARAALARAIAAMQQGLPFVEFRGEVELLHRDGGTVWVDVTASGMYDADGHFVGILVVSRDISERKRAAAAQVALQEQVTQLQKMESIGLLAGGVAHDFNNMLAAILGYAELTMHKVGRDHAAYAYVEAIRTAAQRSTDLTGRLLAFARKQTIAPKVLDLNDTVRSILKILHRLLGEHVRVEWTPASALWGIEADPTHVDQVLTNLAVNARDAITGGDARLEISTSNVTLDDSFVPAHPGAQAGEYVCLRFRDNGTGMDEQTLAHLFEPFFTTKPQGKGTGLGLSTVYGIMKQHGGFVQVESAPGTGTTFQLYFPRSTRLAEGIAKLEMPLLAGSETILLAEDEEGVRAATAEMLRIMGYTVLPARSGEEAATLSAIHTEPIHLLLSDVIMPGMDGARLRDAVLARRPELKVLFMSGYAGEVIATKGVLDPGTHFVQKPFTMLSLAAAVRGALDD